MKLDRDEIDILIDYHEDCIDWCMNRIDELDKNQGNLTGSMIDELYDRIEDHKSRIKYLKEIDKNTDWRNTDYAD